MHTLKPHNVLPNHFSHKTAMFLIAFHNCGLHLQGCLPGIV